MESNKTYVDINPIHPRPRPPSAELCRLPGSIGLRVFTGQFATMPLYEGLGSGGEKTAVVIDLGEAFTK